jgi:signal transduction histidine kinase
LRPENRRERTIPPRNDEEPGGGGDGGRSEPDRGWSPGSAVEGAPSRLRPAMRILARALESDREPPAGDPHAETVATEAPELSLDDIGEALARLRAGLLRAEEGQDPSTRGLRARRHADLDAAAMEAASQILDRHAFSQRRFVEDISHDLRSPLNSILFLADALKSEHSGPLNPVQARQIEVLFMAAVTLVKMVNDVIDFARLGSSTPMASAMMPFSLETVVADVQSLVSPLALHNGVELGIELTAAGLRTGDSQVLNRVLLNLTSNAIHALHEGGSVGVLMADQHDGSLEIVVSDTGQQLPIEKIRAVLDADDPNRLAGETRGWTHGLGLSISARLVRAAGGSIAVDTGPEGGAMFTVLLPFPPL